MYEDFLDPAKDGSGYSGVTNRVKTDGELFLYVNDSAVGLPWIYNVFYDKHQGTARINVRRLKWPLKIGQPSSLCQPVVAAFMEEGHFAAHIRRMREVYRNQRDALVAALRRRLGDHLTVDPPDQGMHLVAYTRRGLSDVTIERAGREHGVVVRAMSRLYVEAPAQSALMLGFSGYPHQITAPAIARLARAFER
jgi:aspartate/methionine/tyrosine aminotransferase